MRTRVAVAWTSICVVMAVVSAPGAAAACSCPWSTLLSPRAGATDVPINAVIVFQSAAATAVVYDLIHDVEVPSTIEPFGNVAQTRLIRPEQPWAPNTTFEVRPLPFSGDTVSTRFTTGTTTDDAAPTYDGFTSLGTETVDMRDVSCRNSCFYGDTYRRMRLGYGPPPDDTALLLMEVYREASDGTPTLATLPLFRNYAASPWPQRIDAAGCTLGVPTFATDENVCARIVAFDMAGHRSDHPREICSRVVACARSLDNMCLPVDECLPGSDPSTSDAGPDGAGSDGGDTGIDAGMPTPTSDAGADAGAPTMPSGDGENGAGCSLSRGPAVPSAPPRQFMIAIAGALWWCRRRLCARRS